MIRAILKKPPQDPGRHGPDLFPNAKVRLEGLMIDRKPIKIASPKVRKVVDTSRKPARVNPEQIAEALGATIVARDLPTGLPPAQHLQLFLEQPLQQS